MKKIFGQTVRDLKRGVNKKVLKVPGVEQKVLDATSNEPWGPHGSLLADIAEATRNYHECQMIMGVLWKRISDTGKNWRHVYKALTVLEYLVAHGSEHVIDEIREHAYQISTLSDFQYIDSSGRDQGNNVRKKSQGLVILVNDKDRIQEARQKADANREKFRGSSAGARRPSPNSGAGGYDDPYEGRYGSRDDDRNAYGRERDGNRDDDRYGRYGDSYSRDGDRYGRMSEERYNYRDDDDSGRGRNADDYDYGSGSRSSDRERPIDDDSQSSSRGNAGRAVDSQGERGHERKFSEQNLAPPSYEEAVGESRSPVYQERDGETPTATPARTLSPPAGSGPSQTTTPVGSAASPEDQEDGAFNEFDPRNSFSASAAAPPSSNAAPAASNNAASAAPTASTNVEMDLLGSLSDAFDSNELAIMPATSEIDTMSNSGQAPTFPSSQSSNSLNQPFGDGPFKAISTDSATAQQLPTVPFQASTDPNVDFGFGDSLSGITYSTTPNVSDVQSPQFQSNLPNTQVQPPTESHFPPASHFQPSPADAQFQTHSTNMQNFPEELSNTNEETDILADILPPSRPPPVAASQSMPNMYASFQAHGSVAPNMVSQNPHGPAAQPSNGGFYNAPAVSYMPQAPAPQPNAGNFLQQHGSSAPQITHQTIPGPGSQQNNDVMGNLFSQAGPNTVTGSQPAITSVGPLAIVPQQSKDKFEAKSTVWADTLSRGLVNLNISGSKINPLSDIGIDFDAINRKDKRMERQPQVPVTSTIMGRAMGSGSGLGRAGVGAMRAPQNLMMGPGMGMAGGPKPGMGMGGGPGMGGTLGMGMGMGGAPGMGMGGYGGMNQPMGMGMGMGMNMGMGQAAPMQQPQTGTGMQNGYNPMMGPGGYPQQHQQPYGGGYR